VKPNAVSKPEVSLIKSATRHQGVEEPPPDVPPLLALVMMVKNEADFINQTLASVKPHIDSWTIVDTGACHWMRLPGSLRYLLDEPDPVAALMKCCCHEFCSRRNRQSACTILPQHANPQERLLVERLRPESQSRNKLA